MKRLLILSCAAKKTPHAEPVPALERYQSPAYAVVRKFIRENPGIKTTIWIVSAKYGVIDSSLNIPAYDLKLNEARRNALRAAVFRQIQQLQAIAFKNSFPKEVFCFLPKLYFSLVEDYLAHMPETTKIEKASGAPGVKLKLLKQWLNKINEYE